MGELVLLADHRRRQEPAASPGPAVTSAAVVFEYTRFDGARCATLHLRRADGGVQSGFDCPALRDWANAVERQPPRRCRWLRNGSTIREVGPFDGVVAGFAALFERNAPHVSFLVDDYVAGW